jgi:patatin-related protein
MHGVTKEIQKLVVASVAFELDQGTNPFGEHDTARVYWDVLAGLASGERRRDGERSVAPRTRVVVDIISGTSAGGINGICLAKALARNRSQDALRDLWFNEGDIKKLVRGRPWLPAGLRFAGFVARSLANPLKVQPPLRGDEMCRLVYKALAGMDASGAVLPGLAPDTLVPRNTLDLYVPITDFHGYDREIPLDDPRFVRDRTHRHVLAFRHDSEEVSHFEPKFNHALAFAARATSSVPGAFPPVSFDSYAQAFGNGRRRDRGAPDGERPNLRDLVGDLFPLYLLTEGAAADRTYFVDGGVLDNFPFRTTIEAIATRPADIEVDRRLLFVEPDPAEGAGMSYGESPTWHGTILGSYVGIPRKEPVLDDFLSLAERNRAVARVRDIIETSFGNVSDMVTGLLTGALGALPPEEPTGAQLVSWQERVALRAAEHAGFAYGTYLRLRVRDVVDRYAATISSLRQFPPGSYHAVFVGNVLRAWARRDDLLAQSPTGTDAQRAFLAQHDLDYHERLVRFVIAATNWWYRDVGKPRFPTRSQLDDAKERLYGRLHQLRAIDRDTTGDRSFVAPLEAVFDAAEVRRTVLESEQDEDEFVARHIDVLAGLREALRERVESALPAVVEGLHADLRAAMAQWSPEATGALLTRYLGFPFWDVLTYPLEALSGVRERDHVEAMRMSPIDVSLLSKEGEQKLYGVALAHFGAFFSRPGREKDYLWGRLDAAERLVTLLLDDPDHPGLTPPDPAGCRPAFEAILADEAGLENAQDLLRDVKDRVTRLAVPAGAPA